MKENSIYKIWTGIFILILLFSNLVRAEERSIYVGDLITLEVSTDNYTLDELKNKFSDFELVSSKESEKGYRLTLRNFEPGEYNIVLGDKKIDIVVSSTLKDMDREGIFTGDLSPLESSYSPGWIYLFYGSLIIFVIIIGLLIWRFVENKRQKSGTPYQRFIKKLSEIETTEVGYFVLLTFFFKEYLENTFTCQIRGKTSGEIITEIRSIPQLEEKLTGIGEWLRLADYYKYTEAVASTETKEKQRMSLKELTAEIEEKIQINEG